MIESFHLKLTEYLPEIRKTLWWEVRVTDSKIEVIQRGGPLEPIVLTIENHNGVMTVEDWWGWGNG